MSAGWKSSAESNVQISDIIRSLPMLAVPGSLDAQRLPKPVPVASALKKTPRARLEVSRCSPPEREDMTK